MNGLNGSGKTTFLNVISGLYLPNDGEVIIEQDGNKKDLISNVSALDVDDLSSVYSFTVCGLFKKIS
ncbi:MAG: ATP-binding cassette domain-containing protein [Bacilli bacterium]